MGEKDAGASGGRGRQSERVREGGIEGGREGAAGKPIKNYMPSNNAPTERGQPPPLPHTYHTGNGVEVRTPSNYFYLFFAFGSSLSLQPMPCASREEINISVHLNRLTSHGRGRETIRR